MPRVIALNGPVGVGKTTLLNELSNQLSNSYVIPEYIDVLDDAQQLLHDYLEGILPAYDFQDYILDYYESVANSLINSSYDYILVERSPVEGIVFFAKLDLDNNRLTQTQYNLLLQRAQLMSFYPNPLKDESITLFTDNLTSSQLTEFIEPWLSNISVIKLRASLFTIRSRIHERGRLCEIEHYTDDYLKRMIESYYRI